VSTPEQPNMSHEQNSQRLDILKDRALMLQKVRDFFKERAVLEVDTPLLSRKASIDQHIDLIETTGGRYLHSSPEYAMKRLLTEGLGDIFQLSHVFRKKEEGHWHNPEFMLIEWYRLELSFEAFILETLECLELFLGKQTHEMLAYYDAMQRYTGLQVAEMCAEDLYKEAEIRGVPLYPGIVKEGKDALLNTLLATLVEPHLGKEGFTVLHSYPASQAALAKQSVSNGQNTAKRFEVYFRGVELANGYDELCDAKEQRARFTQANMERVKAGKTAYPLDEQFLKALEKGMPASCGVAVGFDRLMMLRHHQTTISEVLPFCWNSA